MKTRKLALTGTEVGQIGLGCMSFAGALGPAKDEDTFIAMQAAIDAGINFWDTSNIYGEGRSENLIGQFLAQTGAKPVIATKVGIVRGGAFDNSRDHIRAELEGSLKRLGQDRVELYYIHRREKTRPIEEVVETMVELIDEGLIGGYGLSEVAPSTLRRAQKVHPCMAIQSEYSLWTRLPELGMLQTCAELGVTFVPFSPVARGFLTEMSVPYDLAQADGFRSQLPRFNADNYSHNEEYYRAFRDFCHAKGWPVASVALAWVLDKDPNCLPIPGTRTADHLAEWLDADTITLTDDDRAEIERILPVGWAHGPRYWDTQELNVERYC